MALRKVGKFGGDALDKNLEGCLKEALNYELVIISAFGGNPKVTNDLLEIYRLAKEGEDYSKQFERVCKKHLDLEKNYSLSLNVQRDLDCLADYIKTHLNDVNAEDVIASFGEYCAAGLFAALLGWKFVDSRYTVFLNGSGEVDYQKTYKAIAQHCKDRKAVMTGYYGTDAYGNIKTLGRDASDYIGALGAGALDADEYHVWKTVGGLLVVDTKYADNPLVVPELTFEEMFELAHSGAKVLHSGTCKPLMEKKIPIYFKNILDPGSQGTVVRTTREIKPGETIIGIAGKNGFTSVDCYRFGLHPQKGILRRITGDFEDLNISIEHCFTSINGMSIIVSNREIEAKEHVLKTKLEATIGEGARVQLNDELSIFAVVGQGMAHNKGILNRITDALYRADVNIRTNGQMNLETSIIFGVDDKDLEKAIKSIYSEFFGGK